MCIKIAIVNSSSFGRRFPYQMEKLCKLGTVERFEFPLDISGKELAGKLQGYSIIIASVTPFFNKSFFEYKDETLLITRHGIGFNNIDLESATAKGTIVTIIPGLVEREAVAENAVALLMSVLRQVKPASDAVKEGSWAKRAQFVGHELKDKTVGVIGLGNIGSRVGEILKNGFNSRLIAYDPNCSDEMIRERGAEPVSFEEILQQSDILSLNAYLSDSSYHLLSHKEFSLMKKGIYIVNTARGELMDEKALMTALDNGIVRGIGLDVMEGEPIDHTHPLLKYENVVITPHTSAYTFECLQGMGDKVVEDIENVLAGKIPNNVVNQDVLMKQ